MPPPWECWFGNVRCSRCSPFAAACAPAHAFITQPASISKSNRHGFERKNGCSYELRKDSVDPFSVPFEGLDLGAHPLAELGADEATHAVGLPPSQIHNGPK